MNNNEMFWALTSSFPIVQMSEQQLKWLQEDGSNTERLVFKTKNEAIDGLIAHLEAHRDPIIRIERRKCPECQTEFSDIAGLVSTADGEEWHMTCNNRDCNYVYIQKVKREIEVIE